MNTKSNQLTGYGLMTLGLFCFAINGPVAKLALLNGLSSSELSALRIEGAFLLLLIVSLFIGRKGLRVKKNEILPLIGYGFFGVAMTQFLYFVAIKRIEVGVALIIEFTAPIMVALYLRFVLKRQVSARVWLSLFLAILGLSFITQVWTGSKLDSFGVVSAFGAAVALAIYYIGGEFLVSKRSAISLTTLAMGVGAIFWFFAQPLNTIPWNLLSNQVVLPHNIGSIPLGAVIFWIIFMGTVLPFLLYFMAFKYIDSKRASVFGLLEPVLASVVALILLGETLVGIQILGGIMVLTGVLFAETARN
ncbi:MAG: EamA family transporter [Candidatus Nanopelagicales bacterium]|nr:EamA family transporter [Actinomycetota bacterium]